MLFRDRKDAGEKLAKKLFKYKGKKNVVIIGLPRGGVVTANEAAKRLNLPLDIIVPRKIGAPDNPELAIGAITESGEGIFDKEIIAYTSASDEYIKNKVEEEKSEAMRRLKVYRGDRLELNLKGKIAILIDDGVATGSTMRAAIASSKAKGAEKVVVAAPVIARDTARKIEKEADELIYIDAPLFFGTVGAFYEKFDQTSDDEVIEILKNYTT